MKELKNLEIFTRELIWFRIENIYDGIAEELAMTIMFIMEI